jgi:hypothetical protein
MNDLMGQDRHEIGLTSLVAFTAEAHNVLERRAPVLERAVRLVGES